MHNLSKIPRKFSVIKKGLFFNQSFFPTSSIFWSRCLKSGTYKLAKQKSHRQLNTSRAKSIGSMHSLSKIPRKFSVIKKGLFFNQSFFPTSSIFWSRCLKSGTHKLAKQKSHRQLNTSRAKSIGSTHSLSKIPRKFSVIKKGLFFNQSFFPQVVFSGAGV